MAGAAGCGTDFSLKTVGASGAGTVWIATGAEASDEAAGIGRPR